MATNSGDIDTYLAGVSGEARATLADLRRKIRAAAPDAVESISYGVPTYKYRGRPLIYFGAAKNHCALYGIDVEKHRDELAAYNASKGTVRIPPGEVVPEALVRMLVAERVAAIEASTRGRRRAP